MNFYLIFSSRADYLEAGTRRARADELAVILPPLKHQKGEGRIAADVVLNIGI